MDKTKIAVGIFDKLAERYQDKYMDVGLYHDSLDLFCDLVEKEQAEILELACGPGNITKYLLTKRPDFKIFGTDLAPNMIRLARANNPEASFEIMDSRDIDKINKKYDAVMCGFFLPYLSKEGVQILIKDVSELMNTGGIIYISTMEGDYNMSGIESSSSGEQMFIHYHQQDYLVEALEFHDFRIMDLRHQEFPSTEKKITDLIILAGKF